MEPNRKQQELTLDVGQAWLKRRRRALVLAMAVVVAIVVSVLLALEIHHRDWAQPLLLLPLLVQVARCLAVASLVLHFLSIDRRTIIVYVVANCDQPDMKVEKG